MMMMMLDAGLAPLLPTTTITTRGKIISSGRKFE
jgi:hypothetical protein